HRFRRNSLAFGSFLNRLRAVGVPHACLWSSQVLPKSTEWNELVEVVGYTFPEDDVDYVPPRSLESFLDTDQPVLAIGFGSMVVPHPNKTISIITEAVGRLGAKAVICGVWPKAATEMLSTSDDVYFIQDVPHAWLLRHVQGFVHHGGAGHTAAGIKAGVPMLVLPFFLDQNFWAAKVCQMKLG
ncbi:hypothetical protein B0I35DRAFT_330292, partial [Stachybotrys elegans]